MKLRACLKNISGGLAAERGGWLRCSSVTDFLSNMRPPRALPSTPPRSQSLPDLFLKHALILPGVQFVSTLACGMALTVFLVILPGLTAVARAANPPPVNSQNNALATGSNSKAGTNAMPGTTPQFATTPTAAPVSNPAVATNSTETGGTNSAFVLDDKYKLADGDVLSIRILEDEDDPKEGHRSFQVTDSGDIEAPYIGRVAAENKTCRGLAAELKTELEKEYYYQATVVIAVDVKTKRHGRVYLAGAVRLAGPVDLPSDEVLTLSKAILRAGSFTDYADRRHVKLTREDATTKDDKKTFIVDVGEILDKGRIDKDLVLESGDLIFVPDRLVRF
jgi:protein involved in polysaccharide export with SLBB domain